jgi:hypothetical protein
MMTRLERGRLRKANNGLGLRDQKVKSIIGPVTVKYTANHSRTTCSILRFLCQPPGLPRN